MDGRLQISPENCEAVLNRFDNFYDGVVCSIGISMRSEPTVCEVVLEAMEGAGDGLRWRRVRLAVQGLHEFKFAMGRTTFEVLSSGIQFIWKNGLVYVMIDAFPDDGPGLPDLTTNIAYVAGSRCVVEVESIPS